MKHGGTSVGKVGLLRFSLRTRALERRLSLAFASISQAGHQLHFSSSFRADLWNHSTKAEATRKETRKSHPFGHHYFVTKRRGGVSCPPNPVPRSFLWINMCFPVSIACVGVGCDVVWRTGSRRVGK